MINLFLCFLIKNANAIKNRIIKIGELKKPISLDKTNIFKQVKLKKHFLL